MTWYKIIAIVIFSGLVIERITSTFIRNEAAGKVRYKWVTYIVTASYLLCTSAALYEFISKNTIDYKVSISGLLTIFAGISLRNMSIRKLGRFWSIHIKEFYEQASFANNRTRSCFRYLYYPAVMLELVGLSLFFNAFLSLWLIVLIHLPLLLVRVFLHAKII